MTKVNLWQSRIIVNPRSWLGHLQRLFPKPGPFLVWQPALNGPPFPIFFMESTGPAGTGEGPKISRDGVKEDLLTLYKSRYSADDLFNLERAFQVQQELGLDLVPRIMGIEFLIAWNASPDTIAAFILSPAKVGDLKGKIADSVLDFPTIVRLIAQRKNLDSFTLNPDFDRKQGSKYLKMLMAREENLEVLLLKAADLFLELSQIGGPHPSAHIALEAFAPLLKILGYNDHARQLEDLAFLNLSPEDYKITESQTFDGYRVDRAILIEELKVLAEFLKEGLKTPCRISWRPKGIFSIYEKDRKADDVFGIRIIVKTREDCYTIQNEIIRFMEEFKFERQASLCDDYIRKPKETGYQSLHEAYDERYHGWRVEIQIRSEEMDREAEVGSSSHLRYKLGHRGFGDISLEGADIYRDNRTRLLENGMVFAYDADGGLHKIGPVTELGKRATVLDFAFHCGRDSGNRCAGAEIQRLSPSGSWETIHASFSTPIKNGDRITLRIANEPQPITENRLMAAATEMAAASLGLLKRGREVDLNRRYDELKEEGSRAFKQALSQWEKNLIRIFDSLCDNPRLEKHFRFSLARVYKKLGFDNERIFYTAVGLKGEKRASFLAEAMQIIGDSSVIVGYEDREIEKGDANIFLLVNNGPGVILRLLQFLKRYGISLKAISIASQESFALLKIRIKFNERSKFDGFSRKIEDLYKDLPLTTSLPLRIPVIIKANLNESQLMTFLEDILSLGGNIINGEVRAGTFRKKIIAEFKIAFPLVVATDKVKNKLGRRGYEFELTRR